MMGIHIIKMPDIGEGIAEVELVAWHVKVGDVVAEDQILADVMTDKATVEIPSSVAGTVLALGGAVGQVMAVGSEVIRIEVQGAGNLKAEPAAVATATDDSAAPISAAASAATTAMVAAAQAPTQGAAQTATMPGSAATPERREAISALGKTHTRQSGDKPIASPAVRRRAWELGIELQFVSGTGAGGRVMREDLDTYAARAEQKQTRQPDQRYAERHSEEAVPVIGLRRKIAQKMQESKRRIPHFTYVEEVDVTELETLRAKLNAKFGEQRGRLTMLPFLMRAVVLAVREFPQINARYDDEAAVVTRYDAVHLGIATQTEAGLMVPVVRHAESYDLWASAAQVTRLAEAARSGKAARDELSGSTITITSLGALGGIVSTPVINHPEVAIVGINRIVERPMIKGGAVVARQMMNLSSSFDHRVVDGLHAAEFIQVLRGYLESPATLFVE
jgi:2-oxoisovalerate dehydrogenase E2 component (dihydrolipoyl transacylase)